MASANGSNVHVDVDALQALRDAVYARYGRINGRLGAEASKALRDHAARLQQEAKAIPRNQAAATGTRGGGA